MSKDLMEALIGRRSIYEISKESTISDDRIQEILEQVTLHAPTAFNSQGSRVILLLGENHDKLWELTLEALRKVTPQDRMERTEKKIASFQGGYGTVLFFENTQVMESLQDKFPLYSQQVPVWANQSMGMLQYAIWVALEAEGLGASLQHYNPLIDDAVRELLNIPEDWELTAQMPFGTAGKIPEAKPHLPIEERVLVFD